MALTWSPEKYTNSFLPRHIVYYYTNIPSTTVLHLPNCNLLQVTKVLYVWIINAIQGDGWNFIFGLHKASALSTAHFRKIGGSNFAFLVFQRFWPLASPKDYICQTRKGPILLSCGLLCAPCVLREPSPRNPWDGWISPSQSILNELGLKYGPSLQHLGGGILLLRTL